MLDINSEKPKKSRAQKILDDIENNLRNLIKEKKEIWKKFVERRKEFEQLERQYKENWEEAQKLENKLVLLWDYWHREVEILRLDKQIRAGVLPSEREEIMKKQLKLVEFNKTLEKGFKKREIDAEIVAEIKKRLGVWEGKTEESE
ncbi:MAG: hypothetical protein I3273_00400 [Candidatus Moeniiplasma glomeromycotorum]|nr:hypothetical protein [Candidatus Moeniiplasma glomeromycotorum]MCE8167414.1 hypothetical protein [Candidatus Moeniiplasma glomeromycotorum]MCE8168572.1 hypothetical protein [Candidatus Moeniiplasma glomeromycotorum]